MGASAKIELLAPARDLQAGIVAVDSGADAVYIGGRGFGARHAAANSADDIARLVAYARPFGVRIYATLNTVLYEHELPEAERTARELIDAGVDALIVQDPAYLRMGLEGVEMHASTQMCNMTPEQVGFLSGAGFSRVILERGLTFGQIKRIREACDAELECFVHGAICVGYSGRCFLSRTQSERSGNRGQCSQPCRLSYDLTDADRRTICKGKHLLSVMDLNLSARIPELLDAGITSFKIEGRLKDVSYIRNVVAYYRGVIDRELALRPHLRRASVGESRPDFTPAPAKSFLRGETAYFFDGVRRGVASFDTPKAVGEFIGRVNRVRRDGFGLDTPHDLAAGDGVCLRSGAGLVGTNINAVRPDGTVVPNRMEGIAVGCELYRNYDHRFRQQLERSRMKRTVEAAASVELSAGEVRLSFAVSDGTSASAVRSGAFEPARDAERMAATLREQCAKSGDTMFRVGRVEIAGPVVFVPVSLINELRREALQRLREALAGRPPQRNLRREQMALPYPETELDCRANVTNSLSERFYRDHGVRHIEPGLDLRASMAGERVMTSSYCIRRELGQCLREHPSLKGELYLERGVHRYRLEFDCANCRMSLVYEQKS